MKTPPKYLTGDVFLAHNGSIGVIAEVCVNESQDDPWYASYSAREIKGYHLSKIAWWRESEFKEVLLGPIHRIVSGEIVLKLPAQ